MAVFLRKRLFKKPGLWFRLMKEWPMHGFASMTAQFLLENDLAGGNVLELGAGVGSCSALISEDVGDGYIRSDIKTFLLARQKMPGKVVKYNFNELGEWKDLDVIFSVNALHCAEDKDKTLKNMYSMLRPGGVFIIGEGVPYSGQNQVPWVLNMLLAHSMGGGMWAVLTREDWMFKLDACGFQTLMLLNISKEIMTLEV